MMIRYYSNVFPYIIEIGDTLSSIAERFNTTVKYIINVNPHIYRSFTRVGQVIYIPYRRGPVTAQIATRPIIVNGVDINTGYNPEFIFTPFTNMGRSAASAVTEPRFSSLG